MILILVKQILQMFLLSGIGFLLYRSGKISRDGSQALGNILIYVSLPSVIINGFLIERTAEHMQGILISALAAFMLLLLSMAVSRLVSRKDSIAAFAGAFSNPGFFAIPLILASTGQSSVFYAACFIAFLNIGQWTYGVSLLTGQPLMKGLSLKKLIRAPFVIAMLTGLVLFFTQLPLPDLATGLLDTVSGLNTPLAMFTVGVYLAQTDIKHMFTRLSLYKTALVRNLLIPVLSLFLLALLPASLSTLRSVLLLCAAAPTGSNVAVYAQLHDADYPYAVETVVISTLLSILTIPAVVYLSGLIWS